MRQMDDVQIVGESRAWRETLTQATQVAATDTTVLFTGDSGTGKEVVARYIHRASPRHERPFIALNCAALPEQLLESELFGFERGAFTGATQSKPGQIELAAGGTLFLDEVAEMSPSAQAKFLRVLQEREFQRLGSTRVRKAECQGDCGDEPRSAPRDGARSVPRGSLLSPPRLRHRAAAAARACTDDILPLSEAFLQDLGRAFGRPPAGICARSARRAARLRVARQRPRAAQHARTRRDSLRRHAIDADHLSLHSNARAPRNNTTNLSVVERTAIAKVLQECRGNKTKAARRLGLSRTQLHLRIRESESARSCRVIANQLCEVPSCGNRSE